MDYLQYKQGMKQEAAKHVGFKPYYKWITFNTEATQKALYWCLFGFKPYYKWITFNTLTKGIDGVFMVERSLFYMVAKIEHFSVF